MALVKKGFLSTMTTANKEVNAPVVGGMAPKNPKRVAAGKLNRARRQGLSRQGRERLRKTALQNQPWKSSTGPKTPQGKAKAAMNSQTQRKGPLSVRELRAGLANLRSLTMDMREARQLLAGAADGRL